MTNPTDTDEFMQTCNMDERTNEEVLLDSAIESLIYELCPNTSRAWIYDEDLPEKIRLLVRQHDNNEPVMKMLITPEWLKNKIETDKCGMYGDNKPVANREELDDLKNKILNLKPGKHDRRVFLQIIDSCGKCRICESKDIHLNGFCYDCAKEHYS